MAEGQRPSRRQFVQGVGVAGLGLLAGCGRWPGQGQAEQPAAGGTPLRRIGVIGDSSTARWDAFREGLRELGWVEGHNLAVEYRWGEGNDERYRAAAAELVQRKIELIVAGSLTVSAAAKQATSTIPIVAVLGTDDALEGEIVDNIARPGGNITGTAGIGTQLEAKQLELLKEAVPEASRVAILAHANRASFERRTQALQRAAPLLGVQLQVYPVQDPGGLEGAFAAMGTAGADALKVLTSSMFDPLWDRIADHAARHRLAGDHGVHGVPAGGGPDGLRTRSARHLPAGCDVRRQDPEGRAAGRLADGAADAVRLRDQPPDRPRPWSHHPAARAAPGY